MNPDLKNGPMSMGGEIIASIPSLVDKDRLAAAHRESRASYYRAVLEKEDALFIARLMKIPDDWESYEKTNPHGLPLPPEQKSRLSHIKEAKSQELRFESLYLDTMLAIENSLVGCMSHASMVESDLRETINALGEVIEEAPAHIGDFKHLLLGLARRAVSDLYYFMAFHVRFHRHKEFVFENDFLPFCQFAIGFLHERLQYPRLAAGFVYHHSQIRQFFIKSSNRVGWRLDEQAIRAFVDEDRERSIALTNELTRSMLPAVDMAAHLRADHEFIHAYYNGHDGLMARYEFINGALSQKFDEGRVSPQCIQGFRDIMGRLSDLAGFFENHGLRGFGPIILPYGELLEYAYHAVKFIEYHLLRAGHHDELKALRTDLLQPIEKEYYQLNPAITRTN